VLQHELRAGHPGAGVIAAVGEIGRVLAQYFPHQRDDKDELPNTVSMQ
jgi:uncharacterized membrane protein